MTRTAAPPDLHSPVARLVAARYVQHRRDKLRPRSPALLARRLIPGYQIVPTTALISDVLVDAIANADRRYVLSTPPRSGKSLLASVIGPLYALAVDPDANVIVKSYGDQLALEHSGQARRLAAEHADLLGWSVDQAKTATDRWLISGHRGGVLAGGLLSPTTGFGVSEHGLLIVDDPIKGHAEADSPAYRRRLIESFKADLLSRLHPGASCVVVSSRWHPEDLAGSLLSEADEGGTPWQHVNVPAVSTAGIFDVLNRDPGVAVTSPLGRTAAGFEEIKRAVGSRAWAALYLGAPAAPEGSLILGDWLDEHRLPAAPARPTKIVVAVDPADSGHGDETGIVAASLAPNGTVALIADVSAQLTSDAWANRAVELAITLGASTIHVEGYASATTYTRLLTEAVSRHRPPHPISVKSWRGRGDALARSAGLLAGLENGRCRIAGHLPELETDMTTWQPGQHQPDRVAAAVIAFDVLERAGGARFTFAAPVPTTATGTSGPGAGRPRLGGNGSRPAIDAMIQESAARNRAVAQGRDPEQEPEVRRSKRVVSMAGYLSRRVSDTGSRGRNPWGDNTSPGTVN
jgi:hypothetical protein